MNLLPVTTKRVAILMLQYQYCKDKRFEIKNTEQEKIAKSFQI